jgi:hypothetical protein
MKFIPNPHPPAFRFATEEIARKVLDLMQRREPWQHLAVPVYKLEGDNVLVMNQEYKDAPFELGFAQLEPGEELPDYVPSKTLIDETP